MGPIFSPKIMSGILAKKFAIKELTLRTFIKSA